MSEMFLWSLTILGLVLIAVLVYVIRKQLSMLKGNAAPAERAGDESLPANAHQLDLKESLRVIATLALEDQVELSEASIRIKVLIDHLDADLHSQAPFSVFEEMYLALQHMPTHQARKDTDKKFIRKLDQQRFAIESRHRERIREGARALLRKLEAEETAQAGN